MVRSVRHATAPTAATTAGGAKNAPQINLRGPEQTHQPGPLRSLYCLLLPGANRGTCWGQPTCGESNRSLSLPRQTSFRPLRPFAHIHNRLVCRRGSTRSCGHELSLLSRSPTPPCFARLAEAPGVGVSRVSQWGLCLACCLELSDVLAGLPPCPCRVMRQQVFPDPGFQDGSGTPDSFQ